jgi:hypothetical protein
MARRTNNLVVLQSAAESFGDIHIAHWNTRRVPARKRIATITMTGNAQRLRIRFVQTDIASNRSCIDVTDLASILVPVRAALSIGSSREQKRDYEYCKTHFST